jgi:TolA-binding protein
MLKQYDRSVKLYERGIALNAPGKDYAQFQRGMLYGLMDKTDNKIKSMEQILEDHPRSIYLDDALYEMAVAYHSKEDIKNSVDKYLMLTRKFPTSGYVPQAYLRLGLIHVNQGKDDDALAYYKEVVTNFPKTTESKEALAGIKAIYVAMGRAEEYITYLQDVPEAELRTSEEDSLTYMSAESVFAKGNCEKSVEAFTKYLTRFPDGFFAVQAHFYKGECLYKAKDYEEAYSDFDYVINQKQSMFSERSLVKASRIAFYIREDHRAAFTLFSKLEAVAEYKGNLHEARVGAMKSAYQIAIKGDSSFNAATLSYCHKVLNQEGVAPEDIVAANFYSAKMYFAANETDSAVQFFEKTLELTDNIMAAEGKYHLALIQFNNNDFKASQETCFEIIKQTPSYYDWIVKSYILLADNYAATDDVFQAKATLQSIVDNYEGEDEALLQEAKEKLDLLIQREIDESRVLEDTTNQFITPDSLIQEFEAIPDTIEPKQ